MIIKRIINGVEHKITLTDKELLDAKHEAIKQEIKESILDRIYPRKNVNNDDLLKAIDEVYDNVYYDVYVWQEYDEMMDSEIDRCIKKWSLK